MVFIYSSSEHKQEHRDIGSVFARSETIASQTRRRFHIVNQDWNTAFMEKMFTNWKSVIFWANNLRFILFSQVGNQLILMDSILLLILTLVIYSFLVLLEDSNFHISFGNKTFFSAANC